MRIDLQRHSQTKMARDSKTINVAFDFLCFILVLIDYLVTKTLVYGTTDKLYPIKQGFFCEDKSIQLPFKEPWMDYAGLCALIYIVPIVVVSRFSTNSIRSDKTKESYTERRSNRICAFRGKFYQL